MTRGASLVALWWWPCVLLAVSSHLLHSLFTLLPLVRAQQIAVKAQQAGRAADRNSGDVYNDEIMSMTAVLLQANQEFGGALARQPLMNGKADGDKSNAAHKAQAQPLPLTRKAQFAVSGVPLSAGDLVVAVTALRSDWPVIRQSLNGRGRPRTFVCQQPQPCYIGSLCAFTCVTHACHEEPVIHWRLIGHRVLACEQAAVWQTWTECVVQYDIECFIGDAGSYVLQGFVMYENYELALQAPPACATLPLGMIFTVPGVTVEERKDGRALQGAGAVAVSPTQQSAFRAPPPAPLCTPEQLSGGGGEGRWIPSHEGNGRSNLMRGPDEDAPVGQSDNTWWWQPWACSIVPSVTYRHSGGKEDASTVPPSPPAPLELIIIGDSHQRRLSEYLTARYPPHMGLMAVSFVEAMGLVDHNNETFLNYEYLVCPTISNDPNIYATVAAGGVADGPVKYDTPLFDTHTMAGLIPVFEGVCRDLTRRSEMESIRKPISGEVSPANEEDSGGGGEMQQKQAAREERPWVILESGHWDLRDSSLEHFQRYFKLLLRSVMACEAVSNRVIIRTAPAFSHRRDMWQKREYRTNTKLQLAAQFVKDEIALRGKGVLVLDSFAYTYPRLMESCDTHHYICLHGSGDINHAFGVEVKSTVPVLMHMLFTPVVS